MPENPSITTTTSTRRIAICLDGTWNAAGDNTNVWRLKSLIAEKSGDGLPQVPYYSVGVNGALGGTFGKGISNNIINAYKWLMDQYNDGDEIFILGFSRGAYTARSLAGFVAKCGLLKPGAPLGVNQLYDRYKREDDATIWKLLELERSGKLGECSLEEQWLVAHSRAIRVKLIAVWDTVGTIGFPLFNIPKISRSWFTFLHTGLRLSIENGFHALAIDEHRQSFSPTLWTIRNPSAQTMRPVSSVEQRWFVGAHANVGGGYYSDLLAQAPLRWVMNKASIHGLSFRNDLNLHPEMVMAPITNSHRSFMWGIYRGFSWPEHREIGGPPKIKPNGSHHTVNETIDVSVFERWRSVPTYRPPSLVLWAERNGVDISSLNNSVMANDPSIAAPD